MQSEIDLLRQWIIELEAENAEIPYLRNKLSVTDAEIAELKHRNAKILRLNKEYNERRYAENAKFKAGKAEFLKSTKKYYTDFEGYIVKLKHLSSQYPDHLESIETLILEIKAQNAK